MTSEVRPADEIANALTHGAGVLLSAVGAAFLMSAAAGQPERVFLSCGLYCITLVLLYAMSTLSHTFHDILWRRFFRTLDQACIFLLIAGSCTPIAVLYLNHGIWRLLLVVLWIGAIAGVLLVIRMRNLNRTAKWAYGVLGWFPAIALGELSRFAPPSVVMWLVAGGICYSIGAVFLILSARFRYAHAIWHVFVVGGSTCHYLAILGSVRAR